MVSAKVLKCGMRIFSDYSAVRRVQTLLPPIFLNEDRNSGSTHLISRCAHSDIPRPNFDKYRRTEVKGKKEKDENTPTENSTDERRAEMALVTLAMGTVALYSAKTVVIQVISSMAPASDVLAISELEVKLNDIMEGKTKVFKWRGKPVFVTHRQREIIDQERQTKLTDLRDPETDEQRAQRPEWLIVIGICTHLGCIPIPNAGDYKGGYYCPCHGSHYDGAARIRKGPAPLNLAVPPYQFVDDNNVLIG